MIVLGEHEYLAEYLGDDNWAISNPLNMNRLCENDFDLISDEIPIESFIKCERSEH